MDNNDEDKIKKEVDLFFEKMTIPVQPAEVSLKNTNTGDVFNVKVTLEEPQILIGEKGQTLFEIQRILRTMLNKKMQKFFYIDLDINGYKEKKIEYLKDLAKSLADDVTFSKTEKALLPMPAYERRIIHAELAKREDVVTESSGDGQDRHIVIKPK